MTTKKQTGKNKARTPEQGVSRSKSVRRSYLFLDFIGHVSLIMSSMLIGFPMIYNMIHDEMTQAQNLKTFWPFYIGGFACMMIVIFAQTRVQFYKDYVNSKRNK